MAKPSLQDTLGLTINEWFDGPIDVRTAFDSVLAVMASIAVKAGCNTDERVTIFANHMKTNLTLQLNYERKFGATASAKLTAEMSEKAKGAEHKR